ncbi:MAG TPA: T9SS type A sorting domain-containing protein [Bacteroidia bacterium]|nr:T9SS type A sorting domain-containing protein [Bacteroidia bacterium]
MKKKSLLILFTAIACSILISGYHTGPAANGYDCTGAETGLGNFKGCGGTGGCHSTTATTGITLTVVLDSAGKPTTHYTGGKAYTIVITGTNTTTNSLPKFGFQIGCIKGSVAATTPTNEGTFGSPYPTNTHFSGPSSGNYVLNIVEHSTQLSPSSGTGGNGTVYQETINWTAPAKGTGAVSLWAVLNAVNNNGSADKNDLWNATNVTINEWTITTGVDEVAENTLNLSVYPNPAKYSTTLNYNLTGDAPVQVGMYNMAGQKIYDMNFGQQAAGNHQQQIDLAGMNLKSGIYIIAINQDDKVTTRKLIVQ